MNTNFIIFGGGFALVLFNAERQAEKLCECQLYSLTQPEIEPESTVLVADALSTRPLIK